MVVQSKLRRFGLNARSFALALVVHIALFALIGLNLNWSKPIKPAGVQPIQAPLMFEEPEVEEVVEPLPEPVILEPEPLPEPKPEPLPEPVKTKYPYLCDGQALEVDSEEEARRLQRECEEEARKKKEEKEKELALEKQKKEDTLKQKQLAEKKRQQEERKKKELEEQKRKKAEAEKKRKAEEKRKKLEAEKKRKAEEKRKKEAAARKKREQAKRKAVAEKKAREAALRKQMAADQARRDEGDAGRALGFATSAIRRAVENNFTNQSNWVGLQTVVRVKVQPNGAVLSTRITRSSGDRFFDQEAERAVMKASPLPIPTEPRFYPYINEFDFRFSPGG